MFTFLTNEDEKKYIKTINGIIPDENGNVDVDANANWHATLHQAGHIKGRTHWADWEDGEIIFNKTFTGDYTDGSEYVAANIKSNSYYKVTYNGEEFIAPTYTDPLNYFGYVFCGSDDQSEIKEYPFFIANANGDISYTRGESLPFTIQVQEVFPIYHTLPKEYLPIEATVIPNWNSSPISQSHILNRTHYQEEVSPYYTLTPDEKVTNLIIENLKLGYVQVSSYTPLAINATNSIIRVKFLEYDHVVEVTPDTDSDLGVTFMNLPYNMGYVLNVSDVLPLIVVNYSDVPYEGQFFQKGTYFISGSSGICVEYWSALENIDPIIKHLDPIYIKDMYYSENISSNYILNNQDLLYDATLDAYYYPTLSKYIDKNTIYEVIYNDRIYQLEAKEYTLEGITANLIGNPGVLNLGELNDVPFALVCGPQVKEAYGIDLMVLPLDAAESITLTLSETEEEIHQIDEKYIPDTITRIDDLEDSVKNALAEAKNSGEFDGASGNGIKSVALNPDYTLTLTFDDNTTYTTSSIRGKAGSNGRDGYGIHLLRSNPYITPEGMPYTLANQITGLNNVIDPYDLLLAPNYNLYQVADFDDDDIILDLVGSIKGAPGVTPVKGTDYFTAADKSEMVTQVKNAMPTLIVTGVDFDGVSHTWEMYGVTR